MRLDLPQSFGLRVIEMPIDRVLKFRDDTRALLEVLPRQLDATRGPLRQ